MQKKAASRVHQRKGVHTLLPIVLWYEMTQLVSGQTRI